MLVTTQLQLFLDQILNANQKVKMATTTNLRLIELKFDVDYLRVIT